MEYQYWNSNYLNSISEDSLDDVDWNTETYKGYMYARLQQMFKYKNLPDTIPHEMLEYYLLSGGVCFITEVDNNGLNWELEDLPSTTQSAIENAVNLTDDTTPSFQ